LPPISFSFFALSRSLVATKVHRRQHRSTSHAIRKLSPEFFPSSSSSSSSSSSDRRSTRTTKVSFAHTRELESFRSTWNSLPCPHTDAKPQSPPIIRDSPAQKDNPRPVPSYIRLFEESSCTNAENSRRCIVGSTPTP